MNGRQCTNAFQPVKFTGLLLFLASQANANPMIFHLYGGWSNDGQFYYLLGLSILCLYVEFLLIRWYYKRLVPPGLLTKSFLIVNGITFIPTQFFSLIIGPFAEALPLLLEPWIYRKYLRRNGIFLSDRMKKKVVLSNLASYFCGLGIFVAIMFLR